MKTAAENFLFDAEEKIAAARDYLIAVTTALGSLKSMSPAETGAMHRMADTALDEIKSLERDFFLAFEQSFPSDQREGVAALSM
jgi:hypothetical protein